MQVADQPLKDHSADHTSEEAENKPGQQQLPEIKVHAFASVSSIVPPRMSVTSRRASSASS